MNDEKYKNYDIYIEPNPDQWNEGFLWSVCRDGGILDDGLEFSAEEALVSARKGVDSLISMTKPRG